MAVKLKYISNNDTQSYPICRLKLVVETFEQLNLMNRNPQRKTKRKPLGTSVINSPLFPLSLGCRTILPALLGDVAFGLQNNVLVILHTERPCY